MAIDTLQKRMAALNPSSPWRGTLVDAGESGFTAANRAAAIYMYAAIGATAYVLTADSGTYNITGAAANLEFNRVLSTESGTYTITGTAASLEFNRVISAESGTYTITGTAANLEFNRVLSAASSSYVITGTDATLTYAPSSGSVEVTLTGFDLNLNLGSLSFFIANTPHGVTTSTRTTPKAGIGNSFLGKVRSRRRR